MPLTTRTVAKKKPNAKTHVQPKKNTTAKAKAHEPTGHKRSTRDQPSDSEEEDLDISKLKKKRRRTEPEPEVEVVDDDVEPEEVEEVEEAQDTAAYIRMMV